MKALQKFCNESSIYNNGKCLRVEKINYHSNGFKLKRCGYDIVDKDNNILLSFEPVNYSNGDKWFLKSGIGQRYAKRLSMIYLKSISFAINPMKFK